MIFGKSQKLTWVFRALVYKIFFGKIGLWSYFGKPIYISGVKNIFLGRNVHFYPGARIEVYGDESAFKISNNVSIGQNIHVICSDSVQIGRNTTISSNVFISDTDHTYTEVGQHIMDQKLKIKKTVIGSNCFLGVGSAIMPGTTLGNQCIVGAHSVVNGSFPDYSVIVGNPCKIIKTYDNGRWVKV